MFTARWRRSLKRSLDTGNDNDVLNCFLVAVDVFDAVWLFAAIRHRNGQSEDRGPGARRHQNDAGTESIWLPFAVNIFCFAAVSIYSILFKECFPSQIDISCQYLGRTFAFR